MDYEKKYQNLLTQFRQTLISENEYKKGYEDAVEREGLWRELALEGKPTAKQLEKVGWSLI